MSPAALQAKAVGARGTSHQRLCVGSGATHLGTYSAVGSVVLFSDFEGSEGQARHRQRPAFPARRGSDMLFGERRCCFEIGCR